MHAVVTPTRPECIPYWWWLCICHTDKAESLPSWHPQHGQMFPHLPWKRRVGVVAGGYRSSSMELSFLQPLHFDQDDPYSELFSRYQELVRGKRA